MPRLIKRYENRKLYDTQAKTYIRLEDIAELVRRGEDVQVVDNTTGVDITAQTLAKVIAEMPHYSPAAPSELLHQFVRWSGQSLSSGVAQLQSFVDRAIERWLDKHGPLREIRNQLEHIRERLDRLERIVERNSVGRDSHDDASDSYGEPCSQSGDPTLP